MRLTEWKTRARAERAARRIKYARELRVFLARQAHEARMQQIKDEIRDEKLRDIAEFTTRQMPVPVERPGPVAQACRDVLATVARMWG